MMTYKQKHQKKRNSKDNKRQKAYMKLFSDTSLNEFTPFKTYYFNPIGEIPSLLIDSGEIPTDIYKMIDINPGTFRSGISNYKTGNWIHTNFAGGVHTYKLSAAYKRQHSEAVFYIPVRNELSARNRHVKLARLNVFLEGLNTAIHLNCNPNAENIALNELAQKRFWFYNSYYLKSIVTDYGEKIKRAKAMGVLTGHNCHYMVYYEPVAREFFFEEELLRLDVSKYIGADVKHMLLVVNTPVQAVFWIYFYQNFNDFFAGEKISDYFSKMQIIVMDNHAEESFKLLTNEETIIQKIVEYFGSNDWNLKEHSLMYNEKRTYIVLSLNVIRIIYLLAQINYNAKQEFQILTTPALLPIIQALFRKFHVAFIIFNQEYLDRLL